MSTNVTGIAGARLARVPAVADITNKAGLVVPAREILLIHGEHGTGKRTALTAYLSSQPLPVVRLTLPPQQSSKDIVRWLHELVITTDDLPERDLQTDLLEALAATPRIVVVEHAHRLTKEAAGQLEWMHSHAEREWPLFLVGGPSSATAITRDPLLRGAVCDDVHVKPLTGDQLLRALQDMHELFLGAGPDLLVEIDKRVCHGILAHWVRFLQHAVHLRELVIERGGDPPVLDRRFAKSVLGALPTTMRKAA